MTPLNAEKYMRELPVKNDIGAPARLSSLLLTMGTDNTARRIFHVCCAGLYASHTAAQFNAILTEAGITSVRLSFGAPFSGNLKPLWVNGARPSMNEMAAMVTSMSQAVRRDPEIGEIGRYEALVALGLSFCRAVDASVLITDVTDLPYLSQKLLPPASVVILGAVSEDPSILLRNTIQKNTDETVSAGQRPEVQRAIIDRCAAAGCRLTTAAKLGLLGGPEIHSFSFAGFTFGYRGVEVRLPSVFLSLIDSACAAIDAVRAMRRAGFEIADEAVAAGIRKTPADSHGRVLSIKPAAVVASVPPELTDPAWTDAQREVLFDTLVADMKYAERVFGKRVNIVWLPSDTVPPRLFAALEAGGIECKDVITAYAGEGAVEAARRIAPELVVRQEEIVAYEEYDRAGGRTYIVFGTPENIDPALPALLRGITNTMQ